MNWLFRSGSDLGFKARSSHRDAETDSRLVKSISDAIDLALEHAQAEERGLKTRMDDIISRAALVGGNDADDFMTRTTEQTEMLKNSDADIKRGQDRLATIGRNIANFQFLKASLQARFSEST